jgi:2-phosphosulpholactate phosphatase
LTNAAYHESSADDAGAGSWRSFERICNDVDVEPSGAVQRGSDVTGAVVAIDVIRASTTAAYAFAAGAREIFLVH